MNRTQRILAAILAVQIVLSAIVLWPRKASTGGGGPLFPNLQTADIVAMTVADGDGNAVQLRQVSGAWVLPEVEDYPAENDTVTAALDKIVALNTRRLVTRTGASQKRLQVASDAFVRRVEVETSPGARHVLYLGSSPSYGATHMRAEGSDETYLADNLTPWELNPAPSSWVDTSYFSMPQDQIKAVTVKNAKGTWTLQKDTQSQDGQWTLADLSPDEEPATDTLNLLVNRVASISLLKPRGTTNRPEYGLDNPQAVVTVERTEGGPVTLLIGSQDPQDKSYAVHVSTSPYYVAVSEYAMKSLVENGRSDLLKPEATPTAQQ